MTDTFVLRDNKGGMQRKDKGCKVAVNFWK